MRFRYSDWLLRVFDSYFAAYWNTKWPRRTVRYRIKSGHYANIKMFLQTAENDPIINKILNQESAIWKNGSIEQKMYAVESFVKKKLKYTRDNVAWNQAEYWQTPSETMSTRTGDCEDGSILMYALAVARGIPRWRLKLCAGYVRNPTTGKRGGHAYLIFLRNDMTWVVCDWSYYPTKLRISKRKQHMEIGYYEEIWWTSNAEYSWGQKDVKLNFEGLT